MTGKDMYVCSVCNKSTQSYQIIDNKRTYVHDVCLAHYIYIGGLSLV